MPNLNNNELMELHIRALFTHDADSRILFVNEPDNTQLKAPRLFLGRTQNGNVWGFRADLPADIVQELNLLCRNEPPLGANVDEQPRFVEKYTQILEKHAPVEEISAGPAYCFDKSVSSSGNLVGVTEKNAEVLQNGFDKLIEELPAWQPFVAFIEDNRAVSVCRSVRITPEAHEAGVETLPGFRGKGFAKEVTARWANEVFAAGAIPLYSTSWENKASQAVARKLNFKFYGADFQIF